MKIADRHLWQRFLAIATPYWREDERWRARGLLALLVLLLLAQTQFAVLFIRQTGEFTSALAAHDAERFWDAITFCLVLLFAAVPINAFYYYVRDTLGIHWRRWLTDRFLKSYFSNRHFYELNANAVIDNPDQRVAEDINTFTQRSLYFLLILIGSLLQLVAFSAVLWSISHELVYFLIFYAAAGTMVTVFVFGKVLIGLNFQQLRREADFRFGLVRVRENAESIAFYRGEAQELRQVRQRFAAAFDNFRRLIRKQLSLNLFQQGYNLLTIVIPSAIIAPRVLSGELEVGSAIQAAGAFAAVLSAISLIVENFESLSRFAAGIDRLNTLARVLPVVPKRRKVEQSVIKSVEGGRLALERVTLQTPNYERVLVRELTLNIAPGEGLLIVGESGSGKSSLLRAIAGLWYSGHGIIFRPRPEDILFLPQQPYMLLGSLRAQLLYPNHDPTIADAELLALLRRANLPDLAERVGGLDVEMDWEKLLSFGERQRLAFARALLAQPRFAILDEATSALDVPNEERLYRQLVAGRTTLVSVGHRASVLKYHTQVLELVGDGSWKLYSAKDYRWAQ
ncbi:ABC transporter ATP-binding protein/permease [Azospira restricta]|uniref:ABC transporter ATP-binding protein/permease n=1 Tax=Azospira restricta TaxID=404405 RepID=A0A974SS98_9RHOO|nr:ABC transporter ATP-binding protein/permease [Azospira restricta]QRJ65512.1 ABC transporter ATP-binding protein/permease [Azospira restricta]